MKTAYLFQRMLLQSNHYSHWF